MTSIGAPLPVNKSTQPCAPSRATAPGIHDITTPAISISLLSLPLQSIAHTLSKPGLDQSLFFTSPPFDSSSPPALKNSIGILRCEVISSILLRGSSSPPEAGSDARLNTPRLADDDSVGSEMFICQVLSVETGLNGERDQPLLYWKQRYVGVAPDG